MLLKVFKLIFAVVFINRFHSTKFSLKTTDSFHFHLNSGLKFVLALAHNFFITVKKWLLDSLSGFRNSLPRCPVKRGVLKNFTSFTGKQLCWNLFLINLEVFRPAALLKRDSNTGVFLWNSWNFQEHLRTTASLVYSSFNPWTTFSCEIDTFIILIGMLQLVS